MRQTMKKKTLCALTMLMFSLATSCRGTIKWKDDCLLDRQGNLIGTLHVEAGNKLDFSRRISKVDGNTSLLEFTFKARDDVKDAHIRIELQRAERAEWWMIPSVAYADSHDDNRSYEPMKARHKFSWGTYWWRRMPIPSAVYSESQRYAVATWSDSLTACSIMPTDSSITHCILWPEEDMPARNREYGTTDEDYRHKANAALKAGERITLHMYVSVAPAEPEHRAMAHFLRTCWLLAEKPKAVPPSDAEVWTEDVRRVKDALWVEDTAFTGFRHGDNSKRENPMRRSTGHYEAAGNGQNISLANALLWDYLQHGDTTSLRMGLRTLDCWVTRCRLPNGLFVTHFDDLLENKRTFVDSRSLSQVATDLFEASRLAADCQQERPAYRETALAICRYLVEHQQTSGGWVFDLTTADYTSFVGRSNDTQPTSGVFFVPILLAAHETTGDTLFLSAARRAYVRYIRDLKTEGFTSSFASYDRSADCESALPLLRASLWLHRVTKERIYLDDATLISNYLSTWLWHYDGKWAVEGMPLGSVRTQGLARLTSQHVSLDLHPCQWIPAWLELSRQTGDRQWKEKAQAIWNAVTQPALLEASRTTDNAWAIALRLETLRETSKNTKIKKR